MLEHSDVKLSTLVALLTLKFHHAGWTKLTFKSPPCLAACKRLRAILPCGTEKGYVIDLVGVLCNGTLKNQGDMKQTNKTKRHQKNLLKP